MVGVVERPDFKIVDVKDPSFLIYIHQAGGFVVSVLGLALNIALLYMIRKKCHSADKLKPMLTFSSSTDIIQSILSLLYLPVIYAHNGSFITFNNSLLFLFPNWFVNNLLCSISLASIFSAITCGPLQFIGRLHLLRRCKKTNGSQLNLYVSATFIGCLVSACTTFYFYSRVDPSFLSVSHGILNEAGLAINEVNIHGASIKESRLHFFLMYLAGICLVSNCTNIVCWISQRQFVGELSKQNSASPTTRKMRNEVNKIFAALMFSPLATNVIPVISFFYTLKSTENHTNLSLISSFFFILGPVLNGITALLFVRPYRRIFKYWLGLNKRPLSSSELHRHNAMRRQQTFSIETFGVGPNHRHIPSIHRTLSMYPAADGSVVDEPSRY